MSGEVQQRAGNIAVQVHVFTVGGPPQPKLGIIQPDGEMIEVRLSIADLHDLRYCVDRVLAMLPTEKGSRA